MVVAIPEGAVADLPKDLFADVPGDVVVVDTGNYYPSRDGRIPAIEQGELESVWVGDNGTPQTGARSRRGAKLMRAITYSRYRPPDVLQLSEVRKSVPKDDEVLVRVLAAEGLVLFQFLRVVPGLPSPGCW